MVEVSQTDNGNWCDLIPPEEMFIETTYKAMLDRIAELPLEKADIRLGERVVKVQTPKDRDAGKISVTTEKGENLLFDEVLMTTPLGWLKQHKEVAFAPPLPPRICSAIDAISVGHLEKVGKTSTHSPHKLTSSGVHNFSFCILD